MLLKLIKIHPLDRMKCTMPYAPPQQQRPMPRRIRMPAIPTGKDNGLLSGFHRQANTMATSETLTHFRGRDSHNEVPSCPRSFHGYWIRTWVINLLLKRYLVVTEWIQRTWMVNILLSSCCRKDKLSWFTCTHTPQWLTWNRHQTKLAEKI